MNDEADAIANLFVHPLTNGGAVLASEKIFRAPASPVRIWVTAGIGVVLSGLWVRASVLVVPLGVARGWFGPLVNGATFELLIATVVFGGMFIIALSLGRLVRASMPGPPVAAVSAFGIGILSGAAGLLLSLLLSWVGGHVHEGTSPSQSGASLLALGSIVVLFEAAVEEYVFRGWLQANLVIVLGKSGALILASLVFAIIHMLGGDRSMLSLLNIFLASIFFGLLAFRTGGIAASIGAHFGWNWTELNLLGLAPNPGTGAFGSIVNLDMAGSTFWGGSVEGLNATVAVSFVLCALILPLAVPTTRT